MGKPLEKFWKKGTWQFLVWVRTPAGGTMEFDSHEDGNAKQGSAMELALRLVIAVGCASNERAASAKDALQKALDIIDPPESKSALTKPKPKPKSGK